jgi:hypothetical protein
MIGVGSGSAAKPAGAGRRWGFAEDGSQDQRLGQIDGFGDAVVLGPLRGLRVQEVEAERVAAGGGECAEPFNRSTVSPCNRRTTHLGTKGT